MTNEIVVREIKALDLQIERYAKKFGMEKPQFLESLDLVDIETAVALEPLFEKRISLLKELWNSLNTEDAFGNLLLFSRTR